MPVCVSGASGSQAVAVCKGSKGLHTASAQSKRFTCISECSKDRMTETMLTKLGPGSCDTTCGKAGVYLVLAVCITHQSVMGRRLGSCLGSLDTHYIKCHTLHPYLRRVVCTLRSAQSITMSECVNVVLPSFCHSAHTIVWPPSSSRCA